MGSGVIGKRTRPDRKHYSLLPGETGRQVDGDGYGLRIASCSIGSANVDRYENKQGYSSYIRKKTQIHSS